MIRRPCAYSAAVITSIRRRPLGGQPLAPVLRAALLVALASLVACGGGGKGGDGTTDDSVTQTVGAGGGIVSLPGGPSLAIPPGALGADTAITVRKLATAAPAGAVTALFQFGPEGTGFSPPATVAFTVPTGTTAAAVYWTKAGSVTEFEPLATTLSGTAATASVTHFSRGYVGPPPVSSHAISGTVSGDVAQGVTVGLAGGADRQTTTGPGGLYQFSGLADGAYTVTPSLAGFSFTPVSRQVTVAGADVTGRDFTAARLPADTTPPRVTSTLPPNEWASHPVGSSLSATFSEPIDCGTVTAASFALAPLPGEPVAGTVSCSGTTALFDPAASLTPGTDFVATLGTAVKDLAGNAMAAPYLWGFRTAGGLVLPLTVQATVPSRDAFGGAIDAPVTASFSNLLRCATVTASSFTFSGPSGPLSGTVSCSGNFVAFTPAAPLAQGAVHTATLTRDVRSLANTDMSAPHTWSFTTLVLPAGAWTAPVQLDAMSGISDWPRLAVAANGRGAAAWSDSIVLSPSEGVTRIRAALLGPDGSWGPAATLASRGQTEYGISSARVAVDAIGQALAVWEGGHRIQDVSWHRWVLASLGTPGSGWSPETPVEDTGLQAYDAGFSIEVAMNGAGEAMAVHHLYDPTAPADQWMVAIPRPAGSAVGAAAAIGGASAASILEPAVVVDADGVATVAWREMTSTSRVVAARRLPGAGWSAPVTIDSGAGFASSPSLAADGAGRVLAAWRESVPGFTIHVFAARWVPGAGWSTPQDLEPAATQGSSKPAVALAASGQGLVVWQAGNEVRAVRLTPEGGFSTPARLDIAIDVAGDPDVAIDPGGNGMAVWTRIGENPRAGIYASRYTAGVGWSARESIGPPLDTGPGGAIHARVGADGLGRFTTVWMRNEPDGYTIWARCWE